MAVARKALGLGNALILHRPLERGAGIQLTDAGTIYFLPRGLAFRYPIPACSLERATARLEFLVAQQNIHETSAQIDSHTIARPQQRKCTARRGFRRGMQDRRRGRGAGLTPIAHASELVHAPLDEV